MVWGREYTATTTKQEGSENVSCQRAEPTTTTKLTLTAWHRPQYLLTHNTSHRSPSWILAAQLMQLPRLHSYDKFIPDISAYGKQEDSSVTTKSLRRPRKAKKTHTIARTNKCRQSPRSPLNTAAHVATLWQIAVGCGETDHDDATESHQRRALLQYIPEVAFSATF